MSFPEVDSAIESCRRHLASLPARDVEVEGFLTVYLLVRICGAFEKELQRLVCEKARRANDRDVRAFVENSMKNYRSLKTSDIRGKLLSKFGGSHSDALKSFLEREVVIAQQYSNMIVNRNLGAHGDNINMSFEELAASFPDSKRVMGEVQRILGV